MSARAILGAMIGVSVIAVAIAMYRCSEAPGTPVGSGVEKRSLARNDLSGGKAVGSGGDERPWLSREATDQLVGKDGVLGPAFAGIELGGRAPTEAARARIAELARANDVTIGFEIAGGKLAAIRFAVTFGGCCGYEGADKLAMRFARPDVTRMEGGPKEWANDWAYAREAVHVRVRVHVNRVDVRWERTLTTAELLERIDSLIGKDVASARDAMGDRWIELEKGRRYFLELPYAFPSQEPSPDLTLEQRTDLGVPVAVEADQVREMTLALRIDGDDGALEAALRARWGQPRIRRGDVRTWTWHTAKRTITAEEFGNVVISRSGKTGP